VASIETKLTMLWLLWKEQVAIQAIYHTDKVLSEKTILII